MKNWLRSIRNKIEHRVKLVIYKWCLALLKKLRIYHTADLIAKTNSKNGCEWNDLLLMGIHHLEGDYYKVLYCKPGVAFGHSAVHIDDLITGKANLTIDTNKLGIKWAVEEAISSERNGMFAAGIERIGWLPPQPSNEPVEKLYRDGVEHEALKKEIMMEYAAKLAEQERVRNEKEWNMYRGSRTD